MLIDSEKSEAYCWHETVRKEWNRHQCRCHRDSDYSLIGLKVLFLLQLWPRGQHDGIRLQDFLILFFLKKVAENFTQMTCSL